MEFKETKRPAQRIITRKFYFPNQEERSPRCARNISEQYGISLQHSKIVAELQGYQMGGSK